MTAKHWTTAADMALERGVDPERFRGALRREGFSWHDHKGRWTAEVSSLEHAELERVLATLAGGGTTRPKSRESNPMG